jgi:hypothetical protein
MRRPRGHTSVVIEHRPRSEVPLRQDTATAVETLPPSEQQKVHGKIHSVQELEGRLSPSRTVTAMLQSVCHPEGGDAYNMDLGMLMISDYGVHWLGDTTGRLDLPWGQIVRHDVLTVSLSLIRKSKRSFHFHVTTAEYDLRFHLPSEEMAEWMKRAVSAAQPLL